MLFRKLSLSCLCRNSPRLDMGVLPPDRRAKIMPRPVQAPFPLAAYFSRIALRWLQCSLRICCTEVLDHIHTPLTLSWISCLPILRNQGLRLGRKATGNESIDSDSGCGRDKPCNSWCCLVDFDCMTSSISLISANRLSPKREIWVQLADFYI